MASATQHSRRVDQALAPSALDAPSGQPAPAAGRGSNFLRRILVLLDAAAVAAAWAIALTVPDGLDQPGISRLANVVVAVVAATAVSLALIASQRLYLARVCSVRAVETVRLGRTAAIAALLLQASERKLGIHVSFQEMVGGAALSFAFLGASRDGYRAWLKAHRRAGRHSRQIVIVGANEEGYDLYHLVGNHPELGFRVCGIVGSPSEVTERGYDVPWLGDTAHVVEAVQAAGANGVLVAASSLPSTQLNRVVRDLLVAGVHVHLSSGIRGIDYRRLRSHPLAHEPLFYLEPVSLARWQVATKRALDLVLATLGLLLSLPVLGACALAIKMHDRGPVFFRQQRVGLDGNTFTILKLRTMVTDAEAKLADLMAQNQREGVLFKLANDPRVTPIGRLLRATSLDELPQLINVVRGDMSLVGPRPALPVEVAQFDEELLARQRVRPGITGLWQVEARDSASFQAYQRLDLFYVENWSVSLDLAILLSTVQTVAARGTRALRRRSAPAADSATVSWLLD
ncbi:MAG TPA: sugar transferase [Acidimicrobiia bacterium]|nr:sugar transferase [Acidimicrobiia bacterium]